MARVTKSEKREIAVEVARLKSAIASRVYDAVDREKVSEKELARRVGVSAEYLEKLLGGDVTITLPMMVRLGEALNITWDIRRWSAKKGGAR